MPKQFQIIVPKTHSKLTELMDFYRNMDHTNINGFGSKPSDGRYNSQDVELRYYWNQVFRVSDGGVRCNVCYLKMSSRTNLIRHKQSHHSEKVHSKCPYHKSLLFKMICPLGCQFQATNRIQLKHHLVDFHSHDQLELWGFNREFLKLQLDYHNM